LCAVLLFMDPARISAFQKGFVQYIVLGVLLVLAAGAVAFFQHRHATPIDLTASLTGTGGVTISTPDNNSTGTSPVQVTANVAPGFTGPVRTMEVFRDNTLVYQGPGTTVNASVDLAAGAIHNLTVLALKQNGQLEGSATVYVTALNPNPTPLAPPSSSSVPPLPPVPA
jgi:hypothetical protein